MTAIRAGYWAVLAATWLVVGCGSSDGGGGGDTPTETKAKIGERCDENACADDLFCYHDSTLPSYSNLCTTTCTYSTSVGDSCLKVQANTACIGAGVCARKCGNGLGCPTGTSCDEYGHCAH